MKIVRLLAFTALAALLFAACESPVDEPVDTSVALIGIAVTSKTKALLINTEYQLTVVKTPLEATDAIEWVSSDPAKVTVTQDGKIKGLVATDTPVTITVKSKTNAGVSDTCAVTVVSELVSLNSITINPSEQSITVNEEFSLTVVKDPPGATDDIEWESSDPAKVTVTQDGKIKGLVATDTPVTITVRSKDTATVSGACAVTVTGPPSYDLKLIYNAAGPDTYDDSEATITVPEPVDNRYIINSFFGESSGTAPTGNFNTSGGFVNTTFFYVDHLFTGDFKISARVKFIKTPPVNSTSKGIVIGGIVPASESEIPGTLSNVGGIHFRTSGGSGSTPYAVRSVASKATEQASVGGLNTQVGKEDEYIFEVSRTAEGYTTSFSIGKNEEQVATASVPYGSGADARVVTADTPVFVGFALMAVEAEISQIKVWDGNLTGEPVVNTGDSTPRPVSVASVKIGIQGGDTPMGDGTAEKPQTLIVRENDVKAAGIQLAPIVIPSYADELGVDYFLATSFTNDSTITVNKTTGLVSVTGPGTATIQMISQDTSEAEAYLTITVTQDYVPVGDFDIDADRETVLVNGEATLSTDIPATVTNPTIVWTTSDEAT
ncbi:MAG: Ig-like domain-containing protein, partial [Treponema sp.]|nr:Ig-like domain-containing protein [Treponema sp.]